MEIQLMRCPALRTAEIELPIEGGWIDDGTLVVFVRVTNPTRNCHGCLKVFAHAFGGAVNDAVFLAEGSAPVGMLHADESRVVEVRIPAPENPGHVRVDVALEHVSHPART